ncbi:MAG: butyrate kinase [Lentisphaerota bacterium]
MKNLVLVINPGSTSTKISVFNLKGEIVKSEVIRHDPQEIAKFSRVADQQNLRSDALQKFLADNNIAEKDFAFIVGRGGFLKPIQSGTWIVNDKMIEDLRIAARGEHASNLGAIIAYDIAKRTGVKAYIVDPIVVDELEDVARITGFPEIQRTPVFHALNQKATARKAAQALGLEYENANFIVAHMGGGTTVGAHKNGKVIDVNNGVYGEGPMSPERSGTVTSEDIVNMCYSGKYDKAVMLKKIHGKGGIFAHLGTSDIREVVKAAKSGNVQYKLVLDAMLYQVAKEIGAMSAVLNGKVNAIVITGGLAFEPYITNYIKAKVEFITKVMVFPGEDEMEALFSGSMLSVNGKAPLHEYK